MRLIIAIAICKLLYFIGSRIGRGSSLPGQVALAVCPGALKQIKLPDIIVAVTGSNGKTSTVEFLSRALQGCGMKVGWNREGANQIEGAATLLLRMATFRGRVNRDALVLECDERYARKLFEVIKPSIMIVTNLCRDQMTRNGHHEFIQSCISTAIDAAGAGMTLVLNADDPYVAALANASANANVVWFGVGADVVLQNSGYRAPDIGYSSFLRYDDGAFCPVCKERFTYDYRVTAHMGGYRCGACGFSRPEPDYCVTGLNYKTGAVALDGGITTRLKFPSLTGAYNLVAAIAAAGTAGVKAEDSARALDGYELTGGRTVYLAADGRDGILLVSKHENSLSYNHSLSWLAGQGRQCTVVILVDSISRKYYTSETSWLWDVDFDILADDNVRSVVLAGRYVNELAARFAFTAIDPGKIGYVPDTGRLREYVKDNTTGYIYAVTCFSDKEKLIKAFA